MLVSVSLSPADDARCYRAAAEMHENNLARGNKLLDWTGDLIGSRAESCRAELATARYLGLPDPTWELLSRGDGGKDLDSPLGSIQVRHRREPLRDLATSSTNVKKELVADYYVLTWPGQEEGTVKLVGYATREMFMALVAADKTTWLKGPRYVIPWQELRPMDELLEEIAWLSK